MKEEKNKQTTILIIIAGVLFISLIGISFAYYFTMLRGQNENVISTGRVTINYEEQNTPLTVNKILSEKEGIEQTDYYEFKISASSENNYAAHYLVYLEEMEGNTIDPKYISVYLTDGNNQPVDEYSGHLLYYYDYHENQKIDSDTYRAGLDATTETETVTLEDGREQVTKKVYEFAEPGVEAPQCKVTSYIYIDGVFQRNETAVSPDQSKCRYGSVSGKSYNLDLETSYYNWPNWRGGSMVSARELKTLANNLVANGGKKENIIYYDQIGKTPVETDNTPVEKVYRLRTWISEEYTPTPSSEAGGGTSGSVEVTPTTEGASQTADFATDGIFKFKINVYAEPYQYGKL